eukprot:COSAG02_NODE_9335_length_2251_cov_5.381041_2_plen_136_part_01
MGGCDNDAQCDQTIGEMCDPVASQCRQQACTTNSDCTYYTDQYCDSGSCTWYYFMDWMGAPTAEPQEFPGMGPASEPSPAAMGPASEPWDPGMGSCNPDTAVCAESDLALMQGADFESLTPGCQCCFMSVGDDPAA